MDQVELSPLLRALTPFVARLLGIQLPKLDASWWQSCVLHSLSTNQQMNIQQRRVSSLTGLDLAALLRVLDHNWFRIMTERQWPGEFRHFVKEMQSVRNRWAHPTGQAFSEEDTYRDLDTLQRFAVGIEADSAFVDEVKASKAKLLTSKEPVRPANPDSASEFEVGQVVRLRTDPSSTGAVVRVVLGKPENKYDVFRNGAVVSFYASQLEAAPVEGSVARGVSLDEFNAHMSGMLIRHPSASALYSLHAARVDFVPYQFRPVLKFIRADRPSLLIADSVGVGKTIEAGLILRELQARRNVRSVLVICPKPLVTERKWEQELRKFDERFTQLDGPALRYCVRETHLDGVWPEQHAKTIIPYSLLDEDLLLGKKGKNGKREQGLVDLDPPPRFDLVIVDEAHHIRNPETNAYHAVRFLCENAEAVVFLTATPLQLGNQDLFVLLNVLRPDVIIDPPTFTTMTEPNPKINMAVNEARADGEGWSSHALQALRSAGDTVWGRSVLVKNPDYQRLENMLERPTLSEGERVSCVYELEQLHTLAGMVSRTRRRDIGEFTIRKPETVTVPFTSEQRELHDEVLRIQAQMFARLHGDRSVKFMMTTIRRQVASCVFGLAPLLEDILTKRLDELQVAEIAPESEGADLSVVQKIEQDIKRLLERTRSLDPKDNKLEALQNIIRAKVTLPNHRMMVFSSFRHTLAYLEKHLSDDGVRVGVIHGGVSDEERVILRNRFMLPRVSENAVDVLLFSEVGSEGLDYQFCDCITNYDLPWNPMRVEQRIGRVDRRGQKSPAVAINNLVTPGTIDADIYQRCLMRIGVFQSALGATEDILGEITQEIRDIAESFELTEDERRENLGQIADNKIRLIQEQQRLEERQAELFGLNVPVDYHANALENARSYWLAPAMAENLVRLYVTSASDGKNPLMGDGPAKTLRLSQEARAALLADFQKIPRSTSAMSRTWEQWLKGGSQHLGVTFDQECAQENGDVVLLSPVHPLVRQAAEKYSSDSPVQTFISANVAGVPPGDYPFALYAWQFSGIRADQTIQPVFKNTELTSKFCHVLARATAIQGPVVTAGRDVVDLVEASQYALWKEARDKHMDETKKVATYRLESLRTSHGARVARLQEQLANATDERIRRMRASQLDNAHADFARKTQEIEQAIERADVVSRPVAYGTLRVER